MSQNNELYLDIQMLRNKRKQLEKAYKSAEKARNEADGKMQSRYDTQKEDWALDCNIILGQIEAVDEQIAQLELLGESSQQGTSTVQVGHIVTISIDGDEPEIYLLVDKFGGQKLKGKSTLSVVTPVGASLIGKKHGDRYKIEVNGNQMKIQILDVRTIN